MIKTRVLPVMMARSVRHLLNHETNPKMGEIIDAALDPIRVDCDARRQHHARWGGSQLAAGLGVIVGAYVSVRFGAPEQLASYARALGGLVIARGLMNLSKWGVYGDLVLRLTVTPDPNERSSSAKGETVRIDGRK